MDRDYDRRICFSMRDVHDHHDCIVLHFRARSYTQPAFYSQFFNLILLQLANLTSLGYACKWEWLGPGGLPGLQHQWRVALRAAVGSSPIHSRLCVGRWMIGH
jgi:hypothetical protein